MLKNVDHCFPKSKKCQPKDFQFTVIERNQKIFTFEKSKELTVSLAALVKTCKSRLGNNSSLEIHLYNMDFMYA